MNTILCFFKISSYYDTKYVSLQVSSSPLLKFISGEFFYDRNMGPGGKSLHSPAGRKYSILSLFKPHFDSSISIHYTFV